MQYASFGSISSGTMRTEDLLDTFASELEYHVQRNAAEWCSDAGRAERDGYMALVAEAQDIDFESEDFDEEGAEYVLNELSDALQSFAPPYAYFGSHPGDGADFGYWLTEDLDGCFDGLRVDDTSEVPADYDGEVLHVNDHGNMTLYVASQGNLTEVWGLV